MGGSYLGPEYSNEEIEAELKSSGAVYRKLSDEDLFEEVASALVNEMRLAGCKDVWNLGHEHLVDVV